MKASSGIFGCGEMKPSALACSKPKQFRRPNALDERRDLVGVSDECRADHLCDHGMVRVALRTDDEAIGHRWRW
jgi:hypothetical protein